MALLRKQKPKLKHKIEPVPGEFGRYYVESNSAPGERYIVDVLIEEETNAGVIKGTCPCKGWSVRKRCSHLDEAREKHEFEEVEALIGASSPSE